MFTGHSVLPASSCYALGGPTGSFKSHFVLEMANWIARAGGTIAFSENESKFNIDMARAVMGRTLGQRVYVRECLSFNAVQECLIEDIKTFDALEEESRSPLLQIVDSIVGNATESKQKKLKNEGSIERDYNANALAASNFLPSYMPMLAKKPYFGIWVTHTKEEKEGTGKFAKVTDRMKGGDVWQYRCRMAFVLKRLSDKPKWDDDNWVVNLKFKFVKDASNSSYTFCYGRYTGKISGCRIFEKEKLIFG
jgi:hypothetical protein